MAQLQDLVEKSRLYAVLLLINISNFQVCHLTTLVLVKHRQFATGSIMITRGDLHHYPMRMLTAQLALMTIKLSTILLSDHVQWLQEFVLQTIISNWHLPVPMI